MPDNAIFVPLAVLAAAFVGYFWFRRESRRLDRRYGPDPK